MIRCTEHLQSFICRNKVYAINAPKYGGRRQAVKRHEAVNVTRDVSSTVLEMPGIDAEQRYLCVG